MSEEARLSRELMAKDEQIKVLMQELADLHKDSVRERGEDDKECWLGRVLPALSSGSFYGRTHVTLRG